MLVTRAQLELAARAICRLMCVASDYAATDPRAERHHQACVDFAAALAAPPESAPPGLVALMARWQIAERAWQSAQDADGQAYEPAGLWEERHELFERMLAFPLPASPETPTEPA